MTATTFNLIPASASTDFRGTKIVATASAGTTIHTSQASATLTDHLTLIARNSDTVSRPLTIQFGGTTAPDDSMTFLLPSGWTGCILKDWPIRNALVVKGFSGTATFMDVSYTGAANVIVVWVKNITRLT